MKSIFKIKSFFVFAVFAFALFVAQPAWAAPISWTDWQSASSGSPGSASGTIAPGIGIDYSGLLNFAQLGTGTNYWTEGSPAPYTGSSVVDNAPTAAEMLAISASSGSVLNTVTFSTSVVDPIMALVSVGRPSFSVSYEFDTPFTLLSEGAGYWGDGSYSISGNTLIGNELHGAIQFIGTYSSISWKTPVAEYWHGFTFGLEAQPNVVPEPSTYLLLGSGIAALAFWRRRQKSKKG